MKQSFSLNKITTPSSRIHQLIQEEVIDRETIHERNTHINLGLANSCEDLSLIDGKKPTKFKFGTDYDSDSLSINGGLSDSDNSKIYDGEIKVDRKALISPLSKQITRRSTSPVIVLRPSSFDSKRKYDSDDIESTYSNSPPPKKLYSFAYLPPSPLSINSPKMHLDFSHPMSVLPRSDNSLIKPFLKENSLNSIGSNNENHCDKIDSRFGIVNGPTSNVKNSQAIINQEFTNPFAIRRKGSFNESHYHGERYKRYMLTDHLRSNNNYTASKDNPNKHTLGPKLGRKSLITTISLSQPSLLVTTATNSLLSDNSDEVFNTSLPADRLICENTASSFSEDSQCSKLSIDIPNSTDLRAHIRASSLVSPMSFRIKNLDDQCSTECSNKTNESI